MDEWKVGDPADWGDSVGVPDIAYMRYLNNNYEDKPPEKHHDNTNNKAEYLSNQAWKLYMNFKDEKALDLINQALSYNHSSANNWNIKGIILEGLKRYDESYECYEKSLSLKRQNIVIENKARMIRNWAWHLSNKEQDLTKALNMIKEAIRELSDIPTEEDISRYELVTGVIQENIDYLNQDEYLNGIGKENLITITGTPFYKHTKEFEKGIRLKLVKEHDNKFDKDAIEVYIDDEKVGYVANNSNTAAEITSCASDIQYIPDISYAEYLMLYRSRYHIAKLIK